MKLTLFAALATVCFAATSLSTSLPADAGGSPRPHLAVQQRVRQHPSPDYLWTVRNFAPLVHD